MKYLVYTDGATDHEKTGYSASSYLIRTANTFIVMNAERYRCSDIKVAEIQAVAMSIDYLLSVLELTSEDKVNFYVDNDKVVKILRSVQKGHEVDNKDFAVQEACGRLKELSKKCEWKVCKFAAHTQGFNGNKVADRLAKYALYYGGIGGV